MVAVPLSGLVMAVYSKYGISWFGLQLVSGLDNSNVRGAFKEVHEIVGVVLMTGIVLHVAAAIKHKVVDKDDVLSRMSLK
jgi:cytochrome b561